MQALLSREVAPKMIYRALNSAARYRTKSLPPILGLDLPDIWASPSSSFPPSPQLFPASKADEPVATVIDGKSIAEEIRSGIAEEVCRMKDTIGKVPGLAVILVGQRKDSQSYVRNKIKACQEVGITSLMAELPEDCEEDEVLSAVSSFNDNPSVHGYSGALYKVKHISSSQPIESDLILASRSFDKLILHSLLLDILSSSSRPTALCIDLILVQHMDEERILNVVSLDKDVDGFHPLNMGNLAMRGREPLFVPCTPKGCIELLLRYGVEIMGKKAVVIGRSNIVGMPTSLLLQRHHATVSTVHAFTRNPKEITREADIVVAAIGVANIVRGDWLKPGAVVLDVGINPVEDLSSEYGYRIIGDVCFEEAVQVASAITPVPGGVGPMTIAMLLSNTLDSSKRAYGFS